MNIDIRGKYVLSFLLMVSAAILAAEIFLEYSLGDWLESQLVTELHRHAKTGKALVETEERPLTMDTMERVASLLSQDPELRVTLIGADGTVLGDSLLDGEALRAMDNHRQRPEVQTALQGEVGQSKHYSTTLGQYMLYVAVGFQHPREGSGVVRLSMSMKSVQVVKSRFHLAIIVSGLIAIVTAISLGGLSAHWATHTQRHLIAYAQDMASSQVAPRIQVHANDALAGLARSLNLLAEEKNLTRAQLSEQKSQMAAVLQSMTEGVIAIDGDHCITLVNRSVLEFLHLPSPPIGEHICTCLPEKTIAELGLTRDDSSMEPLSAEFELPGPKPRQILGMVTPLYTHQGHVIVLRDVTERRRLDLIRRDFVANVSHELRTPVSVIQANAQTLLDGALDDNKYSRVLVDAVERNANRLARIISDLLDLSRLEAGQFAMERHTLTLLPIVREVVELVEKAAHDKEIVIRVEVAADFQVHADTEVVRRILINLLDNAVKYIPNQSLIVVRTRRRQEQIRLEVVDNGPGIAPPHRDRLFERFYRVDSGRSRKMGGTGLGLSIVKHLAENMGETVGVEGVDPHGSLFWITLSPPISV
ncbi:MAG: ATP-binding protein [Magnetococcus sp. YQC-3]